MLKPIKLASGDQKVYDLKNKSLDTVCYHTLGLLVLRETYNARFKVMPPDMIFSPGQKQRHVIDLGEPKVPSRGGGSSSKMATQKEDV